MPSPQRRPVAPPPKPAPPPRPPHVRSAERAKLADANERVAELGAHVARLEDARTQAMQERSAIRRAIEEATRALEAEAATDSAALVNAYLAGAVRETVRPAEELAASLQAAEADLERNGRVLDALAREIELAEAARNRALLNRNAAVADVIRTDPASLRLVQAYRRAYSVIATLDHLIQALPSLPETDPGPDGWPIDGKRIMLWRQAVEALATNADAVLPSDATGDRATPGG